MPTILLKTESGRYEPVAGATFHPGERGQNRVSFPYRGLLTDFDNREWMIDNQPAQLWGERLEGGVLVLAVVLRQRGPNMGPGRNQVRRVSRG